MVDLGNALPGRREIDDKLLEMRRPEARGSHPRNPGDLFHGILGLLKDVTADILHALRSHQGKIDSGRDPPQRGRSPDELLALFPDAERRSVVGHIAEAPLAFDGSFCDAEEA